MGFWTDITKVVSDSWTLHSNQSVQNLIDDGDSMKALMLANKKVEKWPKNADPWEDKGTALYELERFRESIEAYKKAQKFAEDDLSILFGLMWAYHDSEQFEEAINCADKLVKKIPEIESEEEDGLGFAIDDCLVVKGDCLSHLGKDSQAIKIFQELLEDDPEDPSLVDTCADLLIDLKKYKDAANLVDKLIEMDPESVENFNYKSIIALRTGKFKESIKFAEKALKLIGEDVQYTSSWECIAASQFGLGNHKDAKKSIEKSLQLDKETAQLWILSAFINKALGKEDDFQKELEIGISLGEKDELEEVLDHISNSLVPAKERKETEKLIQDLVWSKWNWKSL